MFTVLLKRFGEIVEDQHLTSEGFVRSLSLSLSLALSRPLSLPLFLSVYLVVTSFD